MQPFEQDDARIRALYRIPTAPGRERVLEICVNAPPVLAGHAWPGEIAVTYVLPPFKSQKAMGDQLPTVRGGLVCLGGLQEELPFESGSFDIMILHRTLDFMHAEFSERGQFFDAAAFLTRASMVLVSGGVVAGCIRNRNALVHLRAKLRALFGTPSANSQASPRAFSMRSCRKALERAGLSRIELFSLFPNEESPSILVNSDPELLRSFYRRQLEARRPDLSLVGYIVRRLAAELALMRFFCETVFFWGRKS